MNIYEEKTGDAKQMEINHAPSSIWQKCKVGELLVDEAYQKPLVKSRVNIIVKNYNKGLVGAICVSRRQDGKLYILDGQHRVAALKRLGIKDVACQVHLRLTVQDEARMFVNLNKTRWNPSAYDEHKAKVIAQDPIALKIKGIIESVGYNIGNGEAEGRIQAVRQLYKEYKSLGDKGLAKVFHITKAIWGNDKDALAGYAFSGLSLFIKKYGDQIADEQIIKRLRKASPIRLYQKARSVITVGSGEGAAYAYYQAIISEYNHGLGEGKKLQI